MLGRTDSRRRILAVLLAFVVVGGALVSRLVWWQVVQHLPLAAMAERQSTVQVEVPADRGTIYDRSGTVVLATTVDDYLLSATPDQITAAQQRDVGTTLAAILGLDDTAKSALLDKIEQDRAYVVLAHALAPSLADEIKAGIAAGTLPGIALEPEPVRSYPQVGGGAGTSLAAQLLGFVNHDGQGQYGVEQYYQAELAGTPKVLLAERDVVGQPITDSAEVVSPGVAGQDIRLTVDADLQLAVEQEALGTYAADDAKGVSVVVMDPYTGAIYAEASYPSYDANAYAKTAASDASAFIDPVVSSVFEPGSVFKMLTLVAAYEHGTVTPTTKIYDSGTLALDHGQTRIYDADRLATGQRAVRDIVAYSRNVGAARIALGLGATTAKAAAVLAGTWARLGIGQKTGVDLAGEVLGIVHDPAISPWRQIDLANASFGQGVAVTELQLATAYAAMMNGGTLVQPHVVASIGSTDVNPPARGQAMSAGLSQVLTQQMDYTVHTVPWYAKATLVRGYSVGGKTGTAQIWDSKLNHGRGGWKPNKYNYTFVGYIGRGGPQLVIAVTINEATPLRISQGNLPLAVESYALFRRIATDSMSMLDLTKPASAASGGR